MISNSVTHLWIYTNTANSALISPVTPCDRRYCCAERRLCMECRYCHIEWWVFHNVLRVFRDVLLVVHDVLLVVHDVLLVVHDVLQCITMFYKCFMMFHYVWQCFMMFSESCNDRHRRDNSAEIAMTQQGSSISPRKWPQAKLSPELTLE